MIFVKPVLATCPVCMIAVGGGLAMAKMLGVDDLVAAIWIGALVTVSALWLAQKFHKIKLPKPEISWTLIFYLLTVATLYLQGKIGHPSCQLWGLDKILFGLTLGTILIFLGNLLDRWLRSKNQGKVFFPFQKVAIPLAMVVSTSLIFQLVFC
ncbi:MAG TPA: hypothetical protein VMW41_05805 [Candidatus Bathyarchaeia archaeon]|nr:hypothetical protein [Candidatus Bathyarchaeia archaeon]